MSQGNRLINIQLISKLFDDWRNFGSDCGYKYIGMEIIILRRYIDRQNVLLENIV